MCFYLLTEEENVIASVLEVFKKHNPRWEGVNVIISDKAMTERNAIKKAIPQANLQLCLFHILRNFRREITPDKLGITAVEKTKILEILQKIAYSKSDEEYSKHYDTLCEEASPSALQYYNRNGHHIKTEWATGLRGFEPWKSKNPLYICTVCSKDADQHDQSIMCNSCLEWYHVTCARLKNPPKSKFWSCSFCKE